ncbi:hypothetical protein M0R45_018309 [Rubus argutus]|uniref:Uncharacterized protein n=1 Tax=Rubus argutus TaxID=59490 RepID=A0AAW1X3X3_RUBAR
MGTAQGRKEKGQNHTNPTGQPDTVPPKADAEAMEIGNALVELQNHVQRPSDLMRKQHASSAASSAAHHHRAHPKPSCNRVPSLLRTLSAAATAGVSLIVAWFPELEPQALSVVNVTSATDAAICI